MRSVRVGWIIACSRAVASCAQYGRTRLHMAVEDRSDAIVAYCVEERGMDVDARNREVSHLMQVQV